ncbi:MAG: glycosyltransferase family 4 protein [Bacilli bacterium]|nr:glycosyltransferase family 4 protein [Bacilli bacterium]
MKVLLYTEGEKMTSNSGLGKAIKHQMKALESANVEYTTNLKDDYDIIHINFYGPRSYHLAKKAHRKGKKVVYHAHSTEEDFRSGFIFCKQLAPLFKRWLIKCYSLGDVIVTPTPYSKRLLEGYGIKKKIYAISNGIELDLFKKDEAAGERFRKEYNYKKEDKVIIGIGLYITRKGIVDFVELAKRMPEYKFIWFGYSPLAAATEDVRKAVNTKLDNLVFAGYVKQQVIKDAMNGCDVYLFPTYEETEGIPIIEACACKTTAIIRDIPIFEEMLEDGKNVYKAKTVDEFEKKIRGVITGNLPKVGERAYKVAEERDIKKVGEQLKKVYEEVLKD